MAKRRTSSQKSKKGKAGGINIRPEFFGLALIAIALLTLFSLLSFSRSAITEGWINLLERLLGWGQYFIWIIFGMLGLWFLRRFNAEDRDERWEKPIGAILLLLTLVTFFDFLQPGRDPLASTVIGGGGAVGWALNNLLVSAVDVLGAAVILLFTFIVSIILISGLSLRELGVLIRDAYQNFQDWRHFKNLPINQGGNAVTTPESGNRVGMFSRLKRDDTPEPPIVNGDITLTEPATTPSKTATSIADPKTPATDMSPTDTPPIQLETSPSKWHLPVVGEILEDAVETEISQSEIRKRVKMIEETLESFGIEAKVREINQGPAVTQFSLDPGVSRDARGNPKKVRVSRIVNLSNDLALALSAAPIRIEAPIPGRPYVGIEVPNVTKAVVTLRSAMESPVFHQKQGVLKVALGRNVAGQPVIIDLTKMPHLLIAGATGSGKSVCVNAVIASLLCTHTPDTVRLLMVDPKMVELVNYSGIPHMLAPVVTDLERVVGVLNWATREMDRRYKDLAKVGARNITAYNLKMREAGEDTLPYVVIIIDELADLMMMAPDEVERAIARIAQMARAVGMHMILATQRPSVDVVTGLIKANFPARVAFAVSSQIDSRVILDSPGAERLLGKGDMLYMAPDAVKLQRLQGVFVSDEEINRIVKFWGGGQPLKPPALGPISNPGPLEQKALWDEPNATTGNTSGSSDDEALIQKAIDVVRQQKRASTSLLQRRLRIGYAKAARLIDELETRGIISPAEGKSKARMVLEPDATPGESFPEEDAA